MRYRNARPRDFSACVRLLRADGGFQATDRVWDKLEQLWLNQFEAGAFASFQVIEVPTHNNQYEIIAFRNSAFVTEEFCRDYRNSPYLQVTSDIWERALDGHSPLLDRAAIAIANGRGNLKLVVLHACMRQRNLAHPETLRLMTLLPRAWPQAHYGYRCSFLVAYETFGSAAAFILRNIGFGHYQIAAPPWIGDGRARQRSTVFYWDPAEQHFGSGAMMALGTVTSPSPRYRFSPAEQRLLENAIDGRSDREIAMERSVRVDTLRKLWTSIFRRIEAVDPVVLYPSGVAGDSPGTVKRQLVIEHVRQHLEEIRPYTAPANANDAAQQPPVNFPSDPDERADIRYDRNE